MNETIANFNEKKALKKVLLTRRALAFALFSFFVVAKICSLVE